MGFAKKSFSVLVKLLVVVTLAMAFFAGMVGAIWFSLRGEEVKVPEIVGKELEALGLKIKRRSYRYSKEKPNTILEQAPRPGETVKTGQTILVVVAQANPESTEAPAPVKKETEEDIFPPIEEEIRRNKNANVKRPERTRDVIKNKNANLANTAANTVTNQSADNKAESKKESKTEDKNSEPKLKSTATPAKTPSSGPGDVRNRRIIP